MNRLRWFVYRHFPSVYRLVSRWQLSRVPKRSYCWFHDFEHEFDGVSDGWMCHAYQPKVEDDRLVVKP